MSGLLGGWSRIGENDEEQNEALSGQQPVASRFSATHPGSSVYSDYHEAFGERGDIIRFAARSDSPPEPSTFGATHNVQTVHASPSRETQALRGNEFAAGRFPNDGSLSSSDVANWARNSSHAGRLSGSYTRRESGSYSRRESGGYSRRESGAYANRGSGFGFTNVTGNDAGPVNSRNRPVSGGYSWRNSGAWTGDGSSRYDDAEDTAALASRATSRTGSFYTLPDIDGAAGLNPYATTTEIEQAPTSPNIVRGADISNTRFDDTTLRQLESRTGTMRRSSNVGEQSRATAQAGFSPNAHASAQTSAGSQNYEIRSRQSQGPVIVAQPTTSSRTASAAPQIQPTSASHVPTHESIQRSATVTRPVSGLDSSARNSSSPRGTESTTSTSRGGKQARASERTEDTVIAAGTTTPGSALGRSREPVKSSADEFLSRSDTQRRVPREIYIAGPKKPSGKQESSSKKLHGQTTVTDYFYRINKTSNDTKAPRSNVDGRNTGVAVGAALAGGAAGAAIAKAGKAQSTAADQKNSRSDNTPQNATLGTAAAGAGVGSPAKGKGTPSVTTSEVLSRRPSTSGVSLESFKDAKSVLDGRHLSQSSSNLKYGTSGDKSKKGGSIITEREILGTGESPDDVLARDKSRRRAEETRSGDQYISDGKELAESGMLNIEDDVDESFIHPFGEFKVNKQSMETKLEKDEKSDLVGSNTNRPSMVSRMTTATSVEDQEEIDRLMSRMFGRSRQEQSEEEKTRHVGVIFKHLTVKGMGLGAALQPTTSDFFLDLPRFMKSIYTSGPRKAIGKPPVKTIIEDFSGVIRPGQMCLVLGKPGSGCSTFLKVLGNQRFGYESVEGEVTYGGTDWHTMLKKYSGEVLYNPEEDLHYATLSVKRTLEFGLKCKTPGEESRMQGETAKDYVANFLRAIVKLFWIEHTLDTKVGDEYVRGVSGGEKKRVSIAEAMVTKASIQCWDNSTRGLDASTALEYVNSIRSLTDMAHISTAVALYQAGENLYKRFDKVLLIDGGRCAYFGDAAAAGQYFKDLGFVQPDRWTTADFLTSVTDEHERHVKEGWEDRIPRTADDFGNVFKESAQHEANLKEIDAFKEEVEQLAAERNKAQGKHTKRKNYTIPFWRQVIACTHRQFLVMFGDRQTLFGKWGGILFQSLIIGSLFYDLPKTSFGVFTRGGVLFFLLLFNAFLSLAELTAVFQSRPMLLKHKSFLFYRPAAFAIATYVVDLPLVLIQVFLFDIVVYWMANLARTAEQFFSNLLFQYIMTLTMNAFFRSIGAMADSLDSATKVTGVFVQAVYVYTGYLIPPTKMHPWFSWIRWINPIQYGFEALMAIEFHNLDIECVAPSLVPMGNNASPQYQGCTLQGSEPGSTSVSGASYIEVAYRYSYSHVWRNLGIILAFYGFFVVLTAVGMERQKPNKGGASVTIYQRGQVPKSVEAAIESAQEQNDIEKANSDGKEASINWSEIKQPELDGSNDSENSETVKRVAGNETVFTWQNVNYIIPYQKGERQLLQDVQGYVQPGKLTALMGASGAGKTTLLNTLAQRITLGRVEGEFLVDGRPLPRSFQRSSGFAEQMDIHEPTATVREALRFSALLRQPKEVPIAEKYEYCETVIRLLEMENIAGATIGTTGNGLNQEQRKRVTIGVELASKPELLMFLDEPTSGLDSQGAFNIIRLLRKLAAAGQAILCTIHQPSAVLFEEFDELILLKSGGRIVYHGELGRDSRNMIEYFESNGGKKCSRKANPAEYMLEVIGAGDPDYEGPDWGDIWAESDEKQKRTDEINHLIQQRRKATNGTDLGDQREFAMPWWIQIYAVVYRNFVAYWRSPQYVSGKMVLHIITGLFNSFTFWHLKNSSIDMQSRLFSVFMTITIAPPLIQQLQPRFLNLRMLYSSREKNSKIYGWYAFVTAAVVVELPYNFVAGTIYWCCWYWATWFPRDTYTSATLWLYMCLYELLYSTFGQAVASFAPNELLAAVLAPTLFTFVVSFSGVIIPYASLPYFWRSWMYWLGPYNYMVSGMLAPLLHDVPVICSDDELAKFRAPPGQNCSSYAGAYAAESGGYVQDLNDGLCGFCQYRTGDDFGLTFNVYYSQVWRNYGILYAYILFNIAFVFLASYLYLGGGRKLMRWIHSRRK